MLITDYGLRDLAACFYVQCREQAGDLVVGYEARALILRETLHVLARIVERDQTSL